ncbi:MAG: 50S ribosomal protein L5 [Phycisphaerales bacterium]|nr:50S ribosomal protein L5 [Phycisphaerales bacterium]
MAKSKKSKKDAPAENAVTGALLSTLQERFEKEVKPAVMEKFGIKNPMATPQLSKIVVNVGVGKQLENNKLPAHVKETVLDTLSTVTGQKPVMIRARKSVSNFKVREGAEASAMVTIRRDRMWHFLNRLIHLACPRIKDFRGLPRTSFDAAGNYSMGLTEQGVFPEINMAEVQFTHGMNINLVFRNSTPDISRFVLKQLGMPLKHEEEAD